MFENLIEDKLNIKFFKETNCFAFEIENFLSNDKYPINYVKILLAFKIRA